MKRVCIALLTLLLALVCASCEKEPSVQETKFCRVDFSYDVSAMVEANILSYTMQVRAIPMFGGYETGGRIDNWTTVQDVSGSFSLQGLEEGTWAFYLRVLVDGPDGSMQTLDEQFTGSRPIADGTKLVFGEGRTYDDFGRLGIYIRADRVAEQQTLVVRCENLATGAKYDLSGMEWSKVEKGSSYIDYAYVTDQMPAGNWMVHVAAGNDAADEVMSVEDVAVVNAIQDEVLTVRLRAQRFEPGGVEIEEKYHNLEGVVVGDTKAYVGQSRTWTYEPLNEYTQENAVWYFWYVDDRRIGTREPELEYAFQTPGRYLISCVAVGINGEVPKDGSSVISVAVAYE